MRGLFRTAQRPSLAPRPRTSFHFWAAPTPPILAERASRAMKEKRIRASWASPLQLPGFLIDGDYYIIDLLDRTVPALGTLSPSSKPAPQPGTSRTEPAAQLCRRPPAPPPYRGGRPLGHLPWWPLGRVLGWGGRQAASRAGAQQVSGSVCGVWLQQHHSMIVGPTWLLQPELGTWEPIKVGIGGAGATV